MAKKVLILYPHQLYKTDSFPEVDLIYVVEEPKFFGRDQNLELNLHKQKLILHRASMRRYTEEVLWPAGYQVEYLDLNVLSDTGDILDHIGNAEQVYVFDPADNELSARLLKTRRNNADGGPEIIFLHSPNFYLNEHEVRQYFSSREKHTFDDFYQWQRERFNVLIGEDYKPLGGEWQLDAPQLHAAARPNAFPSFPAFGSNKFVKDAIDYVNKHFPDNQGSTDFIWPTSHGEAEQWLDEFVHHRLDEFSSYISAISPSSVWLNHSALASSLNIGLLSPEQVVSAALKRHHNRPVPLASLEMFIRGVLGRREYQRGVYLTKHEDLKNANPLRLQRKPKAEWYQGGLGIAPFDDMLKKLSNNAYVHGSERNMIATGLMLIAELHPDAVKRWFKELFIDTYDWNVDPQIFSVNQLSDDAAMSHILAASDMLVQSSDYLRGEWSDIWDGLFWRFVERHHEALSHHPVLRSYNTGLKQLDDDRHRIISYRAEDFLSNYTII